MLKRILKEFGKYPFAVALSFVFAIIATAANIAAPLFVGRVITFMTKGNTDFAAVTETTLILLALASLQLLASAIYNTLLSSVCQKIVASFRNRIFAKIQKLPLSELNEGKRGEIVSHTLIDVENLGSGLLHGSIALTLGIGQVAGTIALMFSLNVSLALVVVVLTPLSVFISTLIAKRSAKYAVTHQKNYGVLTSVARECIGGVENVVAFNYQETAENRLDDINQKLKASYFDSHFYSALTNPTSRLVNNLVYISVGLIGALSGIGVGVVSSFLLYSNQYNKPFNEITSIISELQTAYSAAKRIYALIDKREDVDSGTKLLESGKTHKIDFSGVDFSYDKQKPLLQNFNLSVKSGERVAIVGPTGSGKTTILNLLLRFYEPNAGSIAIDGTDIRDIPRASLHKLFDMVLQDTWIFHGTVFENIAFGMDNANEADVRRVAALCHLDSFIEKLPNGFDTEISADMLSEGQAQLFCISRVMLMDAPVLILDEATSNIDSLTEQLVQSAFNKLMEGKTSFVVAHRLSTIMSADRILVLKNGNVIEQGSHRELLEQNGFYKELFDSQYAVVKK